jgi:hypothetical protein
MRNVVPPAIDDCGPHPETSRGPRGQTRAHTTGPSDSEILTNVGITADEKGCGGQLGVEGWQGSHGGKGSGGGQGLHP